MQFAEYVNILKSIDKSPIRLYYPSKAMLTLLRTTSILTLVGLQITLGSSGAKAWDLQEQPHQEAFGSISFVQDHPLNPSTQKKFEPDQDNGGPSRTSGAGGH